MRISNNYKKGITWYELIALILFVVVFVYVAIIQYHVIEENIAEISCRAVRKSINTAVATYKTEKGDSVGLLNKKVEINKLLKYDYLKYKPECWCKGVYKLNGKNVVYCTYHNPELGD